MNQNKTKDQKLLARIQNRIRWDIRVSNSDILINVKNGVVTLNGYFDMSYRHGAAVNAITTTQGVMALKDESRVVDDYYRTDKELKILISKQILTLRLLPGEWIDIDVCDGVVKLDGLVYRSRLKAFAARACWELSGIKDCINLISLTKAPEEIGRPLPKLNLFELERIFYPIENASLKRPKEQ